MKILKSVRKLFIWGGKGVQSAAISSSANCFVRASYNALQKESDSVGGSNLSCYRNSTLPWFLPVDKYPDRVAVVDEHGRHRYQDIANSVNVLTDRIADELNAQNDDAKGERICILCPSDVSYVVAQLSAWTSGCIAVPLSDKHPPSQLEYFIRDSQCRIVISCPQFEEVLKPITDRLGIHLLVLGKADYCWHDASHDLNQLPERWSRRMNRLRQLQDAKQFKGRRSLIVYTSGTTGNPKVCIKNVAYNFFAMILFYQSLQQTFSSVTSIYNLFSTMKLGGSIKS
jgi:long-subunit acyl-CoA synthetase (AMP-forming)